MEPAAPLVVVAGILTNERQHLLLAQRPWNKSFAGQWEFPGGKREAAESNLEALTRELKEELGVRVVSAVHRLTVKPSLPSTRSIVIEVFDVLEYHGDVHQQGLEGQALQWVERARLLSVDVLKADLPILMSLVLPRYFSKIDGTQLPSDSSIAWVARRFTDLQIDEALRQRSLCFIESPTGRLDLHPALVQHWPDLGSGQIMAADAVASAESLTNFNPDHGEQFRVWSTPLPNPIVTDHRCWHVSWR